MINARFNALPTSISAFSFVQLGFWSSRLNRIDYACIEYGFRNTRVLPAQTVLPVRVEVMPAC